MRFENTSINSPTDWHRFIFQDTLLVIERYKSGFPPPGDIPFDDLSRNGDAVHITQPLTIPGLHKADTLTIKGTMGAGRLKKRGLIFNIFNSNKVIFIIVPVLLPLFFTLVSFLIV